MLDLSRTAIRKAFGRASASYDAAATLQTNVRAELLERLQLIRVEPCVVVDLGSGPGSGARALSKAFPRADVIAMDLAPEMLHEARRNSGLLRKFHRVGADAKALPLQDHSVDLVFSNLMLQWCGPPDEVFAEVRRVLRPGGFFAFTTFGPQTLQELRAAWAAADRKPHVHEFIDLLDIGSALGRAGFTEPVIDVDRVVRRYADPQTLMRELKTIGARNAASDRPRGLTGRAAYKRMLESYVRDADATSVRATFEIIYGAAWGGLASAPGSDEYAVPVDSIRIRER